MKTVILKVLTSLPELAQECMTLMGEGARPDAENEMYFFAYNNCPLQNGYIRIPVAEHIATALQWMQDNGITSEHAEIIRVEHFGQDIIERGDGELVEELFLTGVDGKGNPQFLGRMGI